MTELIVAIVFLIVFSILDKFEGTVTSLDDLFVIMDEEDTKNK